MSVPRVVIGKRSGQFGLWVSPPGIDASNAANDGSMLINISKYVDQIVIAGIIAGPFPRVIPVSFAEVPFVIIIPASGGNVIRPFPLNAPSLNTTCTATATSLTFQGGASTVGFIVLKRAL